MNLSTRFLVVAIAFSAAVLPGCGQKKDTVVNGTVTQNGKPVTSGSITFYANGEAVASSSILSDGKFVTEGVPYGDVTVTVTGGGKVNIMNGPGQGKGPMSPTAVKPAAKKDGTATPRPESAIPEPDASPETPVKYRSVATSTLKFKIDVANKSIAILLD